MPGPDEILDSSAQRGPLPRRYQALKTVKRRIASITCVVPRLLAVALALASCAGALAQSPPSITLHPQSQSIVAGANPIFTILAAGQTPLASQWSLHGTNPLTGPRIGGHPNTTSIP